MDFFMKTSDAFLPKEPSHCAAQSTVLRIYELFVMTTYDNFEDTSSMRLDVPDNNRTDNPSNTILDRIDEFTGATKQHGMNLFRDTPKHFTQELSVSIVCMEARCNSQQSQAEIQLIIDLLKCTTFFQRQPHSVVNFSLLQAVTSWIQETLQSTPVHLPDITRSAETLSRAVASTSGLGLNDIWSSWTSSISPSSYATELEQAIFDTDDSGDRYSEFRPPRVSAYMLISTQKFDRNYWSTLLQDILKPRLTRLPALTLMTLFHRR